MTSTIRPSNHETARPHARADPPIGTPSSIDEAALDRWGDAGECRKINFCAYKVRRAIAFRCHPDRHAVNSLLVFGRKTPSGE
jgi:hypothetical protein